MTRPPINIDHIINKLDLKEQLLELLILDIRYFDNADNNKLHSVTKLPQQIIQLLKAYPIGGIILFRENLETLEQTIELTKELQQHSKFGRFIGIDQEGGVVSRLKQATDTPGNMALGAINNPNTTQKIANIIGSELYNLGINLNFAPVIDINNNSLNPIIGVRSFGSDPELVAIHGVAYIEGLKEANIISCAKHFPGHGNTSTDTHLSETYILNSAVAIENTELIPFKKAILNNVDMIMTAHIIASSLDNQEIFSNKTMSNVKLPATLSKVIITDLLRHKLGFKGLIASDALDMHAITNYFTPVEATVLALEAGIDLILMPIRIWGNNDIQNFIDYFNQLYHICNNSEKLQSRIAESCQRILKLKLARNLLTPTLTNIITSQNITNEIAAEAITLYKNSKNTLPWLAKVTDKILVLTRNNIIGQQVVEILGQLSFNSVSLQLINNESTTSLLEQIKIADKILFLTYNLIQSDDKINYVINRLNHLNKPYVMLSCRNPYDILYVKDVYTNVLIYGSSGFDQTNFQVYNFKLNLTQAIIKIMTCQNIKEFNTYCPVDLNP